MLEYKDKTNLTRNEDVPSMLSGFAILLLFLAGGQVISELLKVPVPGNVIGMVLLTLAILTGVVKLEYVERASETLLKHLGLFFVPPGVGLILYFDLISNQWLAIATGTIVSTFAVLTVSGILGSILERKG